MKRQIPRSILRDYLLIALGGLLYAAATVIFLFPHSLMLGGTTGISVILESFLGVSPGRILVVINFSLIVLAFAVLGRDMAIRTLVGSVLTTLFVGMLEQPLAGLGRIISHPVVSALAGASVIALASGIMFYVRSSSGGTDIIALIVQKFFRIQIGKALLISDILIVIVGGILCGRMIFVASALGFLVKTFGIDFVIARIQMLEDQKAP